MNGEIAKFYYLIILFNEFIYLFYRMIGMGGLKNQKLTVFNNIIKNQNLSVLNNIIKINHKKLNLN